MSNKLLRVFFVASNNSNKKTSFIKSKQRTHSKASTSIIHQNVQSIGNSIDKINDTLTDHSDCKIFCVSEHWKSEGQLKQLGIKNFKLTSWFCREEGHHGGAAIYVHQSISVKSRTGLGRLSVCGVFECAAIECRLGNTAILVVTVYRPPSGDINLFKNIMEQLVAKVFYENKPIFITGDFNIELLKENKTGAEFATIMNSFNLFPTIKVNTRVTSTSASCIDNIFTNSHYIDTSIIENFISDHTAQKIVFQMQPEETPKFFYKRIFSGENKNSFLRSLRNENFANVYRLDISQVDNQWNSFMCTYSRIFDQNFPLKKVHNKQNKKVVTPELVDCKKRLDLLLTLSNHNSQYKDAYKATKKDYDKLLKNAQIQKYENRLIHSDNKMKSMWAISKEITGNNHSKSEIALEGNAGTIADKYNEFLTGVIPDLLKTLDPIPYTLNVPYNNQSMNLLPLTPKELCELAADIKNKHSCGVDEIPTSIIKNSIPEIKMILCYLINNSFKYGIFPTNLKLALIKPIYKKGDTEKMDSFRPISLLPGFSKVFELAMCKRITKFMNDCHLLNNSQHGFLKGKSTQTALYQFTKCILDFFEKGEAAFGLFLDLSRAYDCLDRDILLKKLEMYGVRGQALHWLRSYLFDRSQIVNVIKYGQNHKSKKLFNDHGIAQGSILGPILFVIYINDIYCVKENPFQIIINYADDTNLLVGNKSLCHLLTDTNLFFDKVSKWFVKNKLILNSEKTNSLFFRTKQSNLERIDHLCVGNDNMIVTENTKFLGLYINEHLDWSFHIHHLTKKLNSVCYGIRVVGKYMNEKTLRILYFANFESTLKYGIIFWGRNAGIQECFVAQKRVIRIVKKMDFNQSCRNVFRQLGVLTVYALYIFECLMFLYRNKNVFRQLSSESYSTRSEYFSYPRIRLHLSQKHPEYMCIKLYNTLPVQLRRLQSRAAFKREIKKLLINLEPYTLDDYLNM